VTGGQLNSFIGCSAFVSNTTIQKTTRSACWVFERAGLGGSSFQPCYTVTVTDFRASTSNLLNHIFLVTSVDGLSITNGYAAFTAAAQMRFERISTGDQITCVHVSNVYFDCVDNQDGVPVGSPSAVSVNNALGSSEQGCRRTRFTGCTFANNDGANNDLFVVSKWSEISIVNCNIINGADFGIQISDASLGGTPKGRYIIANNTFDNLSVLNATGGSVFIQDAEFVAITGNLFSNAVSALYKVLLTGNMESACVVGNVTDGSAPELLLSTTLLNITGSLLVLNAGDNRVQMSLPTSSSGLPAGRLWNDSGTVKVTS